MVTCFCSSTATYMACCTMISSWVVAISYLCMTTPPQLISTGVFPCPVITSLCFSVFFRWKSVSLWRSLHMMSINCFLFRVIVRVTFWEGRGAVGHSLNTLHPSAILEILVEDFVLNCSRFFKADFDLDICISHWIMQWERVIAHKTSLHWCLHLLNWPVVLSLWSKSVLYCTPCYLPLSMTSLLLPSFEFHCYTFVETIRQLALELLHLSDTNTNCFINIHFR